MDTSATMATPLKKTVLITGSNRGLGLALATQYTQLGWRVIGTARDVASAHELHALAPHLIVPMDVADEVSIVNAATVVLRDEPIDVLINNAGVLEHAADLQHTTKTSLMKQLEVNAVGPLLVTRALLPNLQAAAACHGHAIVAHMSSRAGSIGDNTSGGNYGYRASKAALNMLHKCLSLELEAHGITSVALHPGFVVTDRTSGEGEITAAESADALVRVLSDVKPTQNGAFLRFDGGVLPW